MNVLRQALRRAARAYFAPLRAAPWQAAWTARQQPGARWYHPLYAWHAAIARLSAPEGSSERQP